MADTVGMSAFLPYGEWPSPIAPRDVGAAGLKLGQTAWSEGALLWAERRPSEGGRTTVVQCVPGGEPADLLPPPLNVRSAVHEYGGGAFAAAGGALWFVNSDDQAIHCRDRDGAVRRVTPPDRGLSFADLQVDAARGRLIAVCETHAGATEPAAAVVSVAADGSIDTVDTGRDFYASPRLSPDGQRLVWLAWDHPNMPWDGTELWQAGLGADGRPTRIQRLAGGPAESLFGPTFAPDGSLYVVSDADNWWNIQRVTDAGLVPVTREAGEFGLPQWVFGQSTFDFDGDGRLYALRTRDGLWQLGRVDTATGAMAVFDLPFTHMEQLRVADGRVVFEGGSATTPMTLCTMNVDGSGLQRIRASADLALDEAALSTPEALSYATADGETAHALFYPPRHPQITAPAAERPPLLIKCHGGPTGATDTALDPRIQFWTTRGFAVLDVNYRGSAGYGRAYREALYGRWGEADVADCAAGARHLAERGLIDADRVVISGSSAGGYTVLAVLAFTDIAAAGASYYGIGDLERLAASTHKFESRYLRKLIGADRALLRKRSPLYHADRLSCPVLFLQGLKDKVVPPDQAGAMAEALRARGLPVAHVTFPEERHGFRAAANIATAIGSELAFYGRVLGFRPAGELPDLVLDNPPETGDE